jgi:hypothetical protein
MRRTAKNVDGLIPGYRVAFSNFLVRAPLEDSSVIVDGPGLGCASHGLILALLGFERLSKLSAVHFFSSSGYAGFFFNAKQCQKLKIRRQDVTEWNKRNQRRHHIKPIVSALGFFGKKLFGKPWYFRNHLLADALRSAVSEEYAAEPIRLLPENYHFWTYDITEHKFCDIHATSRYSHWTPTDVISSLTAVPGIYEPFEKEGHIYSDAIRGPGVKDLFRDLRKQSRNVLFWHMNREGRRDNTIFIKGHQSSSGIVRILGDFTRFFLGVDNPEFSRSIELSLFDLVEVAEL